MRVLGACPCFQRLPCGVRGGAPAAMLSNRIANSTTKVSSRQICGFTIRKADESGTVTAGERRGLVPRRSRCTIPSTLRSWPQGCAAVPQPSPCGPLRGSA